MDGSYVFDGTVPARAGRQLIYTVWQRSDSPEAFYACSDVVFAGAGATGGSGSAGAVPAPAASAPSEREITDGAARSSVEHGGHGDDDAATGAGATAPATAPTGAATTPQGNAPVPDGAAAPATAPAGERLAETGGDGSTSRLAIGGAAALAVGAAALFASVRRRALTTGRRGR